MTVSFSNGDLHLPNGQAVELLEAIGYSPVLTTHGSMPIAIAQEGVERAKACAPAGSTLAVNILELEAILKRLADSGLEMLVWS